MALFFLSGFPALIYQIVWQRALFTIFGVNVESVTVVVSAFMLGLGLGSLLGGHLSRIAGLPLLRLFGGIELGIAAFGLVSLHLFQWVAASAAGAPPLQTFLLTLLLVLLPTILMGATLPLLVTHLVATSRHVGRSIGILYFVNTLGSAVACFVAALWAMRALGMTGSICMAAGINIGIGLAILAVQFRSGNVPAEPPALGATTTGLPFSIALVIGFTTGFISLGYEIVWYRLYSFITGGSPRCFSFVLGSFLAGIAFGSLASRWLSPRAMPWLVALANLVGFLIVPLVARAVGSYGYEWTLPLVALAAGLLGATFPLLCHAAVRTEWAGAGLSFLYLSNIAGSALGSYLMGFVLMDIWTLREVSVFLLVLGTAAAGVISLILPGAARWREVILVIGLCATGVWASTPLFHMVYERLLYKEDFDPAAPFVDIVETHSGVVTVDGEGHLFGGGAHDGILTTRINSDSCIRPFSLSYFHPAPREVLVVGMAGGAWSQIVGNHPQVERAVVVEINPGYRTVIGRYPEVAPVLRNPKVQLVIDDGRRWMAAHRDQRFDAILMDTVQHWRASATNLLSVEMLTLARRMLKPGGVIYYNTTYSDDVQKTGVTLFPYAWRFGPFLAVSDTPLALSEERWRAMLQRYTLEGRPVLQSAPGRLEELSRFLRTEDRTGNEHFAVESRDSILSRTAGARIITDDNMASEWRR